ncbi:hypothetical protein O7599_24500 [Streptomyces sp. WMMC500]|uniref:DUF6801 domain-containing protein n=1 Tax=Streptomyces sp. WMMC500 TaxID=3015154 RepID=UPI00248CF93B|nr:DUF6801 domain-containing protein [Streptomyces sp. WMMC500]WBB58762.1 hypothetical protein O7599_24500 [Streptomyces sp. WMMC500]
MSPRTGRLTVIAIGALVAGTLPAAGSAAQEGTVSVSAGYVCEPAGGGAVDTTVEFTGSFPASVRPGEAIRPGDLTMSATLGGGLLDGLPADEGTAVAGSASVAMTVAQGQESADYPWAGVTAEPAEVAADGTATVSFSGGMSSATAGGSGDVVFTLGSLTLELQGTPAAPGGTSSPPADPASPPDDPADPAAATLTCVVADGQDATLATVAGQDESGTPGGDDSGGDSGGDDGGAGQGTPGAGGTGPGGADAGVGAAPGDAPAETVDAKECPADQPPTAELDPDRLIEPPPGSIIRDFPGVYNCTAAVGMVNSKKLDGALIANDPRAPEVDSVRVMLNKQMIFGPDFYNGTRSVAEFTLPDSAATFLTFGFMPVSGKVEFTNEPMTIVTEQFRFIETNETTAGFYQSLRIYDVKVNGVPLDVGDDCRTSRPLDVVLKGKYPDYQVFIGGTLKSLVTVPPFTGCGTGGEDLDAVFTAALSGPGNYVELEQSRLCRSPCKPVVPDLPVHD